jgi:hypothetical protein
MQTTLNSDDIIRMAREAGVSKPWDQEPVQWETLERFANLVAAAEREACAKILDDMAGKDRLSNYFQVAAIAIRARGQQ